MAGSRAGGRTGKIAEEVEVAFACYEGSPSDAKLVAQECASSGKIHECFRTAR